MFFYSEPDNADSETQGRTSNVVFFSNSTLNFNNTYINATDEAVVNISAIGSGSEVITLSDDSDQFMFSPSSFTLAAGSSQAVAVTFNPTNWGVKTANLIASSSGGNSATASLTGVCVADPLIITSSVGSLNFSNIYVSQTSSMTFTVSAGGTVQDIVLMSDDTDQFDFSPTSFSMTGSNQTQEVTVYFTPTSNGSKVGLLTLSASGGDVAHVTLSGSATYQPLVLTPSVNSLQFNNTTINTVSSRQFNIAVAGTGSEQLTFTSNSSNFYTTSDPFIAVNGGQNYRITAMFAPTTVGTKTGQLTISSSGGDVDVIDMQGSAFEQYYNNTSLLLRGDGSNGSTVFTDSSPTASVITRNGNTVISTANSKYGGSSMYFDGNGDYLTIPNSTNYDFGAGNFTIEMWVNPSATGLANNAQKFLFGKRASASSYASVLSFLTYSTVTSNFSVSFFVSTNGTTYGLQYISPATFVSPNVWTHLAFVRSGNQYSIYVNGIKTIAAASFSGQVFNNSSAFSVGSCYSAVSPGTSGYSGYIDDFRITKGIARYTSNFTPPGAL
jgi:hypothetical protein